MGNNSIPLDDNYHPVLALYNDATGKVIPAHVGSTVTGSDGLTYGILDVDVTVSVSPTSNQRVNTHAGDIAAGTFVSGSVLSGAFATGAITDLPAKGTAVMTGSTPVTIATNDTVFAELLGDTDNLATLAGAITSNVLQANTTKIGGQTPTLDNTTIQAVSMRGKGGGSGTAGDTSLLLDILGQMTVEQFVQYQIMQGHGFSATTGFIATNASNAFVCLQLACNAISKKVLIFDIVVSNSNLTNDIRVYTGNVATADTALTTALTAYNLQPKSSTTTSVTTLTASPASTTQTTGFTGSLSANFAIAGNSSYSLLQNGVFYYIANADTASVEVANKIGTSANTACVTMRWIEWT